MFWGSSLDWTSIAIYDGLVVQRGCVQSYTRVKHQPEIKAFVSEADGVKTRAFMFYQCGQDKGCVCVGEGGSGADSSDVGHVIQMGMRGGSQNGGSTGPVILLLCDDCCSDCPLLLSVLEVRFLFSLDLFYFFLYFIHFFSS